MEYSGMAGLRVCVLISFYASSSYSDPTKMSLHQEKAWSYAANQKGESLKPSTAWEEKVAGAL